MVEPHKCTSSHINVHKWADGENAGRYAAKTFVAASWSDWGMREYRLYVFEAGRILWPRELRAPDDESAIAMAERSWIEGGQMELWERNRKVRAWGFPDSPAASR